MTAAIVAFAVIAFFSIYGSLRQSSLENQVNELKNRKEALNAPLKSAEKTEGAAVSAETIKTELKKIETEQLMWSKIIEKIENTVPRLKDANTPVVRFKSYNGTPEGKFSISGATRRGAFDPFADIALVIRTFTGEPSFKNVFVPVITKSLTPDGETVLTFSISLQYSKF